MIIDKANGGLKIWDNFSITNKTKPEDLPDHFNNAAFKVRDHHNGWIAYAIRNIKVDNKYFLFTFYFEDNILRSVEFILADESIIPETWDNWSEEKELQKRDQYNHWLTEEIGLERDFTWGTITAVYNAKSGVSNIVLRYKREQAAVDQLYISVNQ